MRTVIRFGELVRQTYQEFCEDQVLTYAAALAYHSILALFPFLLFLLALVTFLHAPGAFTQLLEWAQKVLPPEGLAQIRDVTQTFRETQHVELLSIGVAGSIWAASGGVRATIRALNVAYDVEEERPLWKRWLLSIVLTIGLGLLILLSSVLLLVGPRAAAWLSLRIGWPDFLPTLWSWLRYPLATGFLIIVTAIVYSTFPNIPGFRLLTAGSVFTVIAWILLSLGFQFYLEHFSRHNIVYGSLGAVIILLLYFWLSAIVLLIGGEVNGILHRQRAEALPAQADALVRAG